MNIASGEQGEVKTNDLYLHYATGWKGLSVLRVGMRCTFVVRVKLVLDGFWNANRSSNSNQRVICGPDPAEASGRGLQLRVACSWADCEM